MKKISVAVLAVLISGMGVASAASIKDVCLSYPEKLVWVEKNNECIPIHPCSDNGVYYDLYCNTEFKDIQVASVQDAQLLANLFVARRMGKTCYFVIAPEASTVGQDYVGCKTSDGGFIEFEFDDYSETRTETAKYSYDLGKCIAYGGTLNMEDVNATQDTIASIGVAGMVAVEMIRKDIECYNVSELQCEDMYGGSATYDSTNKLCTLHR
jgi:hypothetical protein